MNNRNCVLAYSGGLDTSAIVPWLAERGYTVHAVLVDVGQGEDLQALCEKALRLGAASAVVRDARPAMFDAVIPFAIGLAATYERDYRLGTALARPFIAHEQVRRARELGGATLVHGATGKGNDQIRFEFAYRSLAPDCPVLAPWKVWDLAGRQELIDYLQARGFDFPFEATRDYSMDENLWHLSVEGSDLEEPDACLDVEEVLGSVRHRFAAGGFTGDPPASVRLTFEGGRPLGIDGATQPLPDLVSHLNRRFRHAPWAWDLVIENRFTGIKSRGLYINPAAKLLHVAVDALARTCLNKPLYDAYAELGRQYGTMLYRGEYFSEQRIMLEAAARAAMSRLNGSVTVRMNPAPHAARINAPDGIFSKDVATFEKSDFSHRDAEGYIRLSWMTCIGRSFHAENIHAGPVETGSGTPSHVRKDQPMSGRRLVPSAL